MPTQMKRYLVRRQVFSNSKESSGKPIIGLSSPKEKQNSSKRTVALYDPFCLFFFADLRATVFTLSKTFETAQKKSCAAFLPIFVMKSGARTIKDIYFVSLDIFLISFSESDFH
jgi:hypothetical protein